MSSSIIITGASSGIGRAVARKLAGWEGRLILTGRSQPRLEETREQVSETGGRASIFVCDLTEPSAVDDLVAFADERDPLYGVVMSAGVGGYGPIADQSPGEWRRILEVGLVGSYQLARAVLVRLASRRRGHMIFLNSVAGLKSFAGNSAYVAAKYGLRGFAETLRLEAREHNLKVTSIYPGATDTEWWDKEEGDFPRHRMLKPEEVAATVEFALNLPGEAVVEELVLRHVGGDF